MRFPREFLFHDMRFLFYETGVLTGPIKLR